MEKNQGAKKSGSNGVQEIKGKLEFQRVTREAATFKIICDEMTSNPIAQFKKSELLNMYDPEKHIVAGEVVFKINVSEK